MSSRHALILATAALALMTLAASPVAAADIDIRQGGSLWARVEDDGYIRIDGSLKHSDVPFAQSGVTTFDRIHVYNIDMSNAWYDNITFTIPPPPPPTIFIDGFESGDLGAWSRHFPTAG